MLFYHPADIFTVLCPLTSFSKFAVFLLAIQGFVPCEKTFRCVHVRRPTFGAYVYVLVKNTRNGRTADSLPNAAHSCALFSVSMTVLVGSVMKSFPKYCKTNVRYRALSTHCMPNMQFTRSSCSFCHVCTGEHTKYKIIPRSFILPSKRGAELRTLCMNIIVIQRHGSDCGLWVIPLCSILEPALDIPVCS